MYYYLEHNKPLKQKNMRSNNIPDIWRLKQRSQVMTWRDTQKDVGYRLTMWARVAQDRFIAPRRHGHVIYNS